MSVSTGAALFFPSPKRLREVSRAGAATEETTPKLLEVRTEVEGIDGANAEVCANRVRATANEANFMVVLRVSSNEGVDK
mmetsp:Transcript_1771/g.3339  ORF Transcript_1771/g.3339 Transcript_1771/m.3339 type:complete len:80 (-) Transcript_1771:170-409(-)